MATSSRKRNLRKSASSRKLNLSVYQQGNAVIREARELQLSAGKNSVQLEGLPTAYVENSLVILGATGPGPLNIGSSSYEPASMYAQTILQKAVGTKVTFIEQSPQGTVRNTGILKFLYNNTAVLEQDGAVIVVPVTQKFELVDGIPDGLSSTPALVFEPSVDEPGKYNVRFLYEASNLNWSPRYNAFFDQGAGVLRRFECVVDITNQTGLEIEGGVFNLFTGANFGPQSRNSSPKGGARPAAARAFSMSDTGGGAALESAMYSDDASVESLGEQKLYALPVELSIGAQATRSTNLFLAEDVPADVELYVAAVGYYQNVSSRPEDLVKQGVSVRLRVKNEKDGPLGKDMPAGEVSFFVYDSGGNEQKVDSAVVSARAKGEAFKLDLRKPSTDVKFSRRLTFLKQDQAKPRNNAAPAAMSMQPEQQEVEPLFREEEREIVIYNFKDTAVEVLFDEQVPENAEYISHKPDFATAHNTGGTMKLSVPAKDKTTVTYRIKYRIN